MFLFDSSHKGIGVQNNNERETMKKSALKLLALLAIFSFVAISCGDDDDSSSSSSESSSESSSSESSSSESSSSEAAEEEAAEEEAAEEEATGPDPADGCGYATEGDVPGIDKENGIFKIGTSQPFTGRAAVAGEALLGGLIMAVDELNENGGIDGCMFELAWEDDRFEIEQMVTNVRKMIDVDNVWGFVGTAGSQAIPSTYPAIEAAGTPLWGPVSPANQDIKEVYLTNPTRTEQGRICIDYFVSQGATKIAVIGQDNELGAEAFAAIEIQQPVHGYEIVAEEEIEVLSDVVAPAVLAVIDSGADAVLTALDNAQNGLVLDGFHEAGFNPMVCSDAGSSGAGGGNTVSLATPEAADGYLGALQVALPDTDSDFVNAWRDLWEAYDGPGKDGAANFSLQTYSIAQAFFELIDRLDGNYSYENFHAVAETLVDDPILVPSIPPIACGPLPGGHQCAAGAGVSAYDAETESWTQVKPFESAAS